MPNRHAQKVVLAHLHPAVFCQTVKMRSASAGSSMLLHVEAFEGFKYPGGLSDPIKSMIAQFKADMHDLSCYPAGMFC